MIRWPWWLAALVLAVLLIRFSELAMYFLAAVAISFIGRPVVAWLSARRVGRWHMGMTASAALTLSGMLMIATTVVMLFAPLVQEQLQALTSLRPNELANHWLEALAALDRWTSWVDLSGEGVANSEFLANHMMDFFRATDAAGLFSALLASMGNLLVASFSILFMSFFLMREPELFKDLLLSFTPGSRREAMLRIMETSGELLTRYFGGLVLQVGIITAVVGAGLTVVGVPHGWLLGLFAGLCNLIPYVGPLVGAAFGMLVMISSGLTWGTVGLAMIMYGAAQLVDNLFTQPVIFAKSVHAHPLEIFAVISIAGSLAGPAGMVLAIPAYTLFRIIIREFFNEFQWVQAMTKRLDKRS
ncbi:MAG: AI-2E family transporter [Bacteroidetes bacterium]|nr:AI-2E family transporter [Bacteroidota bacterium]MDA0903651.1 AI-2E family transporter [Bacteroidota bacterium]MDA1242595.1 AI-2E family transporter [Bacteroidota bacterium]